MKERAGKKKVVLELGGNAGVIVDETAEPRLGRQALPDRRVRLRRPGLHQRPADVRPRGRLGRVHGEVRRGRRRPSRSATRWTRRPTSARWSTTNAASRTQRWVDEAVALGGTLLAGGTADGTFFPPTILTDVPLDAQVCSNEAFAPLVVAFPFRDLDEAIAQVNDSIFGLQTGVFTNDLAGAWRAFGELEVGGVIVNDIPTYRIDHMPYGGVKDSGLGREGLRWAIEDMTEIRIMVLAWPQWEEPGAAPAISRCRPRPSRRPWFPARESSTTRTVVTGPPERLNRADRDVRQRRPRRRGPRETDRLSSESPRPAVDSAGRQMSRTPGRTTAPAFEQTAATIRDLGLRVMTLDVGVGRGRGLDPRKDGSHSMPDAIHLACAIRAGATTFVTNDRRMPTPARLDDRRSCDDLVA